MSFKSELKNFGLGNRGPYGRMQSGGERLGETLGNWADEKREAGWNKALLAASVKNGKPKKLTPQEIIEVSDMWEVPLKMVSETANKINENWEVYAVENFGKAFSMLLENELKMTKDPAMLEKRLPELVKSANKDIDLDPREAFAISGDLMQRYIKSQQYLKMGQKDRLVNLSGEQGPKVVIDAEDEKPETDKSKIWLHNDKTEVEVLNREKDKYLEKGWKEGKFPGASGTSGQITQKDMAADIRAAAQKLIGIEAGENIVKEIMASEANTAARKALKTQLLVMIKEFEERFGPAAARAVGFDTTLSKPEKKKTVVRTGIQNGKKVVEYDDGSVEYAD